LLKRLWRFFHSLTLADIIKHNSDEKNTSIFDFTISTIISCRRWYIKTSNSGETIKVDAKENLNIQTKEFSEIDSTGILIFPLKMGENKDNDDNYSYKEMPYYGFWNILFYNTKTKETHLIN
jgi:hypothetical protein